MSSNVDQRWSAAPEGNFLTRLAEGLARFAERFIAPYTPGPWRSLNQTWARFRTPEINFLSVLCDPQKTSIDVGAGNGTFAVEAVRFSATCIAFESDPILFSLLRRLSPKGMLVEHRVVSNVSGTVAIEASHMTNVPAIRLDDCAFGEVGFIKIDVSGHEDEVLAGAAHLLTAEHPALLITLEERQKANGIAPTVERLAQIGYRGFFLSDRKILGISQFYGLIDQPLSYRLRRKRYIKRFAFVHESDTRRISALSTGDMASARRMMDARSAREFTIGELAGQIYAERGVLAICVILGLLGALYYIYTSPRLYSATMVIGRNIHDTAQPANMSGTSQLVRSLTGGGETDDKYQRFLMTLTSNRTARRLDQKLDLIHTANKTLWDPVHKVWKRPHGVRFEFDQRLNALLGLPAWRPPSVDDLSGYLTQYLTSTQTTSAGIYRLEVLDRDPQMARAVLQNAFVETNELFREEDRKSAEQSVAYVLKKLSTATVLEDRQALTDSLADAERQLLMINIEPNYVAEPLNDVAVSNGPVRPFVMLALTLGPLMGFFLGALVALFRRQRP